MYIFLGGKIQTYWNNGFLNKFTCTPLSFSSISMSLRNALSTPKKKTKRSIKKQVSSKYRLVGPDLVGHFLGKWCNLKHTIIWSSLVQVQEKVQFCTKISRVKVNSGWLRSLNLESKLRHRRFFQNHNLLSRFTDL